MTIRLLNFLTLLVASWCVLTVTHEAGHLVGGWLGGGVLQEVDLLPWHLPYCMFEPDPFPLLTLWSGPVLGVALPWLAAGLSQQQWMKFIAHFCTLANGLYLATAWFVGDRYLDTPRLLEAGAHPGFILLYCLLTISVGYPGFRRACMRFFQEKIA